MNLLIRSISLNIRPHVVANGLMNILWNGEHGSIWVIENGGLPYEVCIPEPQGLRRSFKNDFVREGELNGKIPATENHGDVQASSMGLASCA